MPNKCPLSTPEFELIRQNHSTLVSTGCTQDFCQSGRVIHTDEPRIGENRSLAVVEKEAEDYLKDLHREGFFLDEEAFQVRLHFALYEIRAGSTEGIIRESQERGTVGGVWTQTPGELEFGLRRAWRNARKCIMRSHCEELNAKMAVELIHAVSEAFNDGNILPTVFVFPPRTANNRGPMIWNDQILTFAGYEITDGSTIGDPKNVQLTKAIIELGWEPPQPRGRWDVLPLVTMAEGDLPVIAELPSHLRALVKIRHPKYYDEFEELDLKWVAFPALSRLGFDIGGVQYTATPFIGWFMDAEIGVRNLGDTFRYNVLPDIIQALHLDEEALEDVNVDSFGDLPEYQQLAILSRAQTELNYAVYHSFLQKKVTMSDSLTASMKWNRYDDDFQKKNGYRLPSDPYWLAPPQGSIIPVWHRGGAPNYQPKPMICRHVQDPLKAWEREKSSWPMVPAKLFCAAVLKSLPAPNGSSPSSSEATLSPQMSSKDMSVLMKYEDQHDQLSLDIMDIPASIVESPQKALGGQQGFGEVTPSSIAIYYCSAGTIAEKLAVKLYDKVKAFTKESRNLSLKPHTKSLDDLDASELTPNNVFLLVVSTTGTGDIPANGTDFADMCKELLKTGRPEATKHFKYALFGNGDSRYTTSFNHGAEKVDSLLKQVGGQPLIYSPFAGDTALQSPPWSSLTAWWAQVESKILDTASDYICPSVPNARPTLSSEVPGEVPEVVVPEKYIRHALELRDKYQDGRLVTTNPRFHEVGQGSLRATIDVGAAPYEPLSCIQLLPLNSQTKVDRALLALGVPASCSIQISATENPTFSIYLQKFTDLEQPFLDLSWLERIKNIPHGTPTKEDLSKLSVLDALETLFHKGMVLRFPTDMDLVRKISFDMPLLRPRTYSVASSLRFLSERSPERVNNEVDIIVKVYQRGRFSDIFLRDVDTNPGQAILKFQFVESIAARRLKYDTEKIVPLVAITTGAGFGPVRSLLQERISIVRNAVAAGKPLPPRKKGISLFVGLQRSDVALATDILVEAASLNIVDMFFMVPSNAEKVRVQDKMRMETVATELRKKLVAESGMVFVCTGPVAAKEIASTLENIVGGRAKKILGTRYIEEVF
ncbi:nitric oxide synthase [Collybia nuda]|uniref:nitric-oxide synthase (NADPH) n=1 Tax=Collybia nuda TaxID=64659 RepID=A0A9P6CJ69_9AGAR|nr:nitric oxide synthase [Collybia nuda]